MGKLATDHAVTPNVSVYEWLWGGSIDAAADVGPMEVLNVIEIITSLPPVVPLAAHSHNVGGFINHGSIFSS